MADRKADDIIQSALSMTQDDRQQDLTEQEQETLLELIVGVIDIPMLVLALTSLVLIIIEFTVSLTPGQSRVISLVQALIWMIFILEYTLRMFTADDRLKYLRNHVLDALIVFIPVLRILRITRAFRAIRLLRIVHPSALARTFFTTRRTFRRLGATLGRSSFQYVLLTTAIVIILAGAGMFLLERDAEGSNIASYGDALWYVFGVITTVGNELYPITAEGRILAVILMAYGVGIFGYIAGTLASYFIRPDEPAPPSPARRSDPDRDPLVP